MINHILLIMGIFLIIFGYIVILFLYLSNKGKNTNMTAQEITLKILDDETSINLIKNKESIFSKYNINRKMVKLSSSTYDSSDNFSLSIASLLSGYAISNNKYLSIISKVFKELKIFSYSPFIVLLISIITINMGDAKIGIVFLILIAIYQYILNDINNSSIQKINTKKKEINKILNIFTNINTLFFISTLIQILRLVVIILNI